MLQEKVDSLKASYVERISHNIPGPQFPWMDDEVN